MIGALEARESARQIEEITGPFTVTSSGAGLTALGLAASTAIYLVLGWRSDTHALRAGAITGAVAGLVGGALRVLIIFGPVTDMVTRHAVVVVPVFFQLVFAIFVLGSGVVSATAGAAIAFAGARVSRVARTRPLP